MPFLTPFLPLFINHTNKFAGMNWHFSKSTENYTSSDTYFLPVEVDTLLAAKDEEYVEIVLKNGTVCFGPSMSSDPRQHRVCASIDIGPLSALLSGVLTTGGGLFHTILLLFDDKIPPLTLCSGTTRLAISLVFGAAVVATIGKKLGVVFRVSPL